MHLFHVKNKATYRGGRDGHVLPQQQAELGPRAQQVGHGKEQGHNVILHQRISWLPGSFVSLFGSN